MISTPSNVCKLTNIKTKKKYLGLLKSPLEVGTNVVVQFNKNTEFVIVGVKRYLMFKNVYYIIDKNGLQFQLERIT